MMERIDNSGSFDLYDEKGKRIYNPIGSISHESMALYRGKGGYYHNNVGYNNNIVGESGYNTK